MLIVTNGGDFWCMGYTLKYKQPSKLMVGNFYGIDAMPRIEKN